MSQELKKFLDDASEGAIYMSLGSNVRSAFLDEKVIEMFKQTFSELSCKVLWKWENDSLPGISKNVLLKKWFPQQDILAHRNVRVFIMQGGIQSTDEAIFNKVPLIVLPFLGDQMYNAKRVEIVGIGKYINPYTLTKELLKETILEVLQNPKYRNKAAEISKLSLDQPMTGIEKAVWWTEYVIRNKGTKYLRNDSVDAPAYKYFMLDILLFLISVVYVIYLLIKSLSGFKRIVFLSILIPLTVYILI
ncbi:UDP-glucuronosyltransferase 1-1-like [Agrilus planipennis]|uniref:UDP-glucuronosyltransferase n=1 Tax=Agrilus planipennis TaxID=224129 RepID=A0A1W4X4K6_AGRPL|nr:UDP-glucuronosyltransferase 1-1-like [Agrilus planipennis]